MHKSHMVNARYVSKFDREETLLMTDGRQLTISRGRKECWWV